MGCLWHSHGKNPVRLYPKLQRQPIGLRKIFSRLSLLPSRPIRLYKNLYRFLIDLLPLKNVEIGTFFAKFVALEFSHSWFRIPGLGWLVNQRNPSGYWKVTKGDLSQLISFLHDSFLFRCSFFIRF